MSNISMESVYISNKEFFSVVNVYLRDSLLIHSLQQAESVFHSNSIYPRGGEVVLYSFVTAKKAFNTVLDPFFSDVTDRYDVHYYKKIQTEHPVHGSDLGNNCIVFIGFNVTSVKLKYKHEMPFDVYSRCLKHFYPHYGSEAYFEFYLEALKKHSKGGNL